MQPHHLPINPLDAELNLICHLLALLGTHHILHVSKIRVKHADGFEWTVKTTVTLVSTNKCAP